MSKKIPLFRLLKVELWGDEWDMFAYEMPSATFHTQPLLIRMETNRLNVVPSVES